MKVKEIQRHSSCIETIHTNLKHLQKSECCPQSLFLVRSLLWFAAFHKSHIINLVLSHIEIRMPILSAKFHEAICWFDFEGPKHQEILAWAGSGPFHFLIDNGNIFGHLSLNLKSCLDSCMKLHLLKSLTVQIILKTHYLQQKNRQIVILLLGCFFLWFLSEVWIGVTHRPCFPSRYFLWLNSIYCLNQPPSIN